MHTFNMDFTATMTELKTKRFTNLGRQEQLSERIWHLENSVIEQRVEETEVRETFMKAMSELKELEDRWKTLSSLIDHEQQWFETIGMVSEWVWHDNIDSLTQKYYDVFSELNTADQDTHLEAAISILDTMEGVAS